MLFELFTYKINNREMWSYLKDSKISKYLPSRLFSFIEYNTINILRDIKPVDYGLWVFIDAVKV